MCPESFKRFFCYILPDWLFIKQERKSSTPSSALRTSLFTRRHFLRFLLGLPLLSSFPFKVREVQGEPGRLLRVETGGSIAGFFKGEELSYDIGFWIFPRAALGRLSFKETEKK